MRYAVLHPPGSARGRDDDSACAVIAGVPPSTPVIVIEEMLATAGHFGGSCGGGVTRHHVIGETDTDWPGGPGGRTRDAPLVIWDAVTALAATRIPVRRPIPARSRRLSSRLSFR